MKRTKKTFVFVLLAAAMVISLLSFGGVTASAWVPDEEGTATAYYLFDYYPTVSKMQMEIDYPNHTVTYDRQFLNESNLVELVTEGYFSNYTGELFVVDIKLFQPSAFILMELFSQLKASGCVTIFVSAYASTSYTDTGFLSCVDEFLLSDFSRLDTFMENVLLDMAQLHQELDLPMRDICFVVDRYALGSVYLAYSNLTSLVNHSPLVRRLLDQLADYFNISTPDYALLIFDLAEIYGIKILIQTSEYGYADISAINNTGAFTEYTVDTFADLPNADTGSWNRVCGLGITSLTSSFYNLMKAGEGPNTSVYYIEGVPVVYSEDGLVAICDNAMGTPNGLDEVSQLLSILDLYLS